MYRGTLQATVHGVARVGHNLETKPPPPPQVNDQRDIAYKLNLCIVTHLWKPCFLGNEH